MSPPRILLAPVCLCLLAGCAGMSKDDNRSFQAYIGRTVTPGMPFVAAIQTLAREGFDCDERSSAPAIFCSRRREGFLYTCMQAVKLSADAGRTQVLGVEPRPILCTGL
jgi:hypothetical protein